MADEVLKLLIKRVPVMKPATLHGYQRHKVKSQVFPAILPSTSTSMVQGQVSPLNHSKMAPLQHLVHMRAIPQGSWATFPVLSLPVLMVRTAGITRPDR